MQDIPKCAVEEVVVWVCLVATRGGAGYRAGRCRYRAGVRSTGAAKRVYYITFAR